MTPGTRKYCQLIFLFLQKAMAYQNSEFNEILETVKSFLLPIINLTVHVLLIMFIWN